MNQVSDPTTAGRPSLIDYLIVLCKWKKVVAGTALGFAALAALAAFLMPPVYRAETRVLPPDTDTSTSGAQLLSQLGGISLAGGLSGKKSLSDLYVALLQSRTVLDRMVERFALSGVYRVEYREDARQRLAKALQITSDRKSGLVTIGVEDRDPRRAASMADTLVQELARVTQDVAVGEAAQRRLFYQTKLKDAQEALIRSEEAMKGFQQKTGTIEMKEQAKAVIENVARTRAQIAAKEVSLKVLRSYTKSQNPDLQKSEDELRGMKEQLALMEAKGGANLGSSGSILEAGTGYLRQVRDLKYNETLFELLAKQYEMARMDESRTSASIQVIDRAVVPEKRVRPQRTKIVVAGGLMGVLGGLVAAFILEKRERLSGNAAARAKFELLMQYAGLAPQRAGKG